MLQLDSIDRLFEALEAYGALVPNQDSRRSQLRTAVTAVIDVQPLNAGLTPCGDFREALTTDISPRGLGLVADLPEEAKYLNVRFRIRQDEGDGMRYEITHRVSAGGICRIGARPIEGASRRHDSVSRLI